MVDYGAGDLYWGRCGRVVSLLISTGDDVVGNGAMGLLWGGNSRIWCCSPTGDNTEKNYSISLLGKGW